MIVFAHSTMCAQSMVVAVPPHTAAAAAAAHQRQV